MKMIKTEGVDGTDSAIDASAADSKDNEQYTVSSLKPIRKKQRVEDEDVDEILAFFSPQGLLPTTLWSAETAETNLSFDLPNSSIDFNNTIGIEAKIDKHSKGWALNISPADDKYCSDVLFHFNPRYGKMKIMMTDRIGTWGTPTETLIRDPSQQGITATNIQLKIQIRQEGFLVFANNQYCAFFAHRRDIHQFKDLKLVFLAADDNGKREEVTIEKVWWGHQDFTRETLSPSMNVIIRKAVADIPESVTNPIAERTVIVEGLPILTDLELLQGLEYNILDLFEPFHPEKVALVTGQGYGYIRLKKSADVAVAIEDNNGAEFEGADGETYTMRMRPMAAAPSVVSV